MRICLAVAVILALGVQANAQGIGKKCSADANAKGLYGEERIHFLARCKAVAVSERPGAPASATSKPQVTNANGDPSREPQNQYYAHCLGTSTIIGACPLCVALSWLLEDERHCYVY